MSRENLAEQSDVKHQQTRVENGYVRLPLNMSDRFHQSSRYTCLIIAKLLNFSPFSQEIIYLYLGTALFRYSEKPTTPPCRLRERHVTTVRSNSGASRSEVRKVNMLKNPSSMFRSEQRTSMS